MNGNFLGIGADLSVNASVLVENIQPYGLLITNGEFTTWRNDEWLPNSDAVSNHVVVSSENTGSVRFVNSAFWGPSRSIADIEGNGLVSFTSCEFVEWSEQDGDDQYPAINLRSGKLVLNGNNFQQNKAQVNLEKGTNAIISANVFTGSKRWVDNGASNLKESANLFA